MTAEEVGDAREAAPVSATLAVGVALRRRRGVTRWTPWSWSVAALLPGAAEPPAGGRVLAEDADNGALDIHAATLPIELHRAEVEGYKVSLAMTPPSVFVVLRPDDDASAGVAPSVLLVTASAYEAQDYGDCDDEIVEVAAAPEALVAWIDGFVEAHWRDEQFKKRKRDRYEPPREDGRGDARVRQTADVYRSPAALKPARPAGRGAPSDDAEDSS